MEYKLFLIVSVLLLVIPFAHADNLQYESQWLEFETNYLAGKIKFMDNLDVFNDAAVLGNYQKQLKYIRGLYHCSKMGYSLGDILDYVKTMSASNGIIRTHPCIRDYVVNSKSSAVHLDYLLEYLKDNPTFYYLKNRAEGNTRDYEEVFVNKALELEQEGRYTEAGDIYGRMITYILNTDDNFRTHVGWGILNTNELDRQGIEWIYTCSKYSEAENPFMEFWEKTNNRKEYNAGISCVDSMPVESQRITEYKRLAVVIRSDTFISLVKMSRNKDGNLYRDDIQYTLKRYGLVLEQVKKLEERNKDSNFVSYEMYNTLATPSDDYIEIKTSDTRSNPLANSLHKLATLNQKINYLAQIKPKTITYAQIAAVKEGIKGCSAGFVGGFTTWEGAATNVGFFVAGGLTTVLSGGTSLVAGGLVLASGTYLTYEGFKDISTQWDQLDLEGKSEAACQIVMPIVMQGVGTKVFHSAAGKAKSYTKSKSSVIGKESIWTKDLVSTEKIKTMIAKARKGKTVTEQKIYDVETHTTKLIEQLKERYCSQCPTERFRIIQQIGDAIGANDDVNPLSIHGKEVYDKLSEFYFSKKDLDGAYLKKAVFKERKRLLKELKQKEGLNPGDSRYDDYDNIGAEVAIRLALENKLPDSIKRKAFVLSHGLDGPYERFIKKIMLTVDDIDEIKTQKGIDPDLVNEKRIYLDEIFEEYLRLDALQEAEGKKRIFEIDEFRGDEIKFYTELASYSDIPYIDEPLLKNFFSKLGTNEIAMNIDKAIRNIDNGKNMVKSFEVKFVDYKTFKTVWKVTAKTTDGRTLEFVIKRGRFYKEPGVIGEIEAMKLLGDDIVQKPLIDELIENVGGSDVFMEEYVPGETIVNVRLGRTHPVEEILDAKGELYGKLYLKPEEIVGDGRRVWYNEDLPRNEGNMKMYTKDGKNVARVVDYDTDPTYNKVVQKQDFIKKIIEDESGIYGNHNIEYMLKPFVKEISTKQVGREEIIGILREVADDFDADSFSGPSGIGDVIRDFLRTLE